MTLYSAVLLTLLLCSAEISTSNNELSSYARHLARTFRSNLDQNYLSQYMSLKRQLGHQFMISQPQRQFRADLPVGAFDLFFFNGSQYAVVSRNTLNDSYIASVSTDSLTGSRLLHKIAYFSLDSFVDSKYSATFQRTLHDKVIEIKCHVFEGQVLIMAALGHGTTLLFLVKQPSHSWTPKYQDSVLSEDEVAGDFVFFERNSRLYMVVAVSDRFVDGRQVTARQSYMYMLEHGIKWLQVFSVPSHFGATSVTTFASYPHHYIVVGQKLGHSLVYRYSSSSLQLFQHLPSAAVVSVEAFSSHYQQYVLVVSSEGAARVFWWTSEQLVVWQTIEPAVPHHPVLFGHVTSLPDHSSFIYLVQTSVVSFYSTFNSYEGRFSLSFSFSVQRGVTIRQLLVTPPLSAESTAGHAELSYHMMMSAEQSGTLQWLVYRLPVALAKPAVAPSSDTVLQCMDRLQSEVERLEMQVSRLLRLSSTIFTRHVLRAGAEVTGRVSVVSEVFIRGAASVDSILLSNSDGVSVESAVSIGDRLRQSRQLITIIDTRLQNVLTVSSQQTISADFGFSSLNVYDKFHAISASHLGSVLGRSASRLLTNSLTFSGDQTLEGDFAFSNVTMNEMAFSPGGTVNDISVSSLLHTGSSQVVSGEYSIGQLRVTDGLEAVQLNGLDVSQLLLQGDTLVLDRLNLTSLRMQLLFANFINDRNLTDWSRQSVALHRDHQFGAVSVPLLAAAAVTNHLLNTLNTSQHLTSFWPHLNGANVTDITFLIPPVLDELTVSEVNGVHLNSDLLTLDTEQSVSSSLHVAEVRSPNALTSRLLNGVLFPQQVVFADQAEQTEVPEAEFSGNVTISQLVTAPEADVSLTGVSLSALLSALSDPTGLATLQFDSAVDVEGSVTVAGDVTLSSTLNQLDLSHLERHFWTVNASDLVFDGPVQLEKLDVRGRVFSPLVNAIEVHSLLFSSDDSVITGNVSFTADTLVSRLLLADTAVVNGVDLAEFAASVASSSNHQIILGSKVFLSNVTVNELEVDVLNGLFVPDELLLVSEQDKNVSVEFSRDLYLLSGLLSLSDIDITESVNNVSAETILMSVFGDDRHSPEFVNRTLNIHGDVHFSDLQVTHINGVPFSRLVADLLQVDESVVIARALTVDGSATFLSTLSVANVNGLDWNQYLSSLVLRDVGGVVSGTVALDGAFLYILSDSSSVLNSDRLNNVTLSGLLSDHLRLSTSQTVQRELVINGSLSTGLLNVTEINKVPVTALVFRSAPALFRQPTLFLSPVHFASVSVASGGVGSCDLERVWRSGLRRTASRQLLRGAPLFVNSLHVQGSVTGLHETRSSVAALHRLLPRDSDALITGELTFEQPLVVRSAAISLYNNHNLTAFFEDIITDTEKNVSLSSLVEVSGSVFVAGSVTVRSDAQLARLSGLALTAWLTGVLRQSQQSVTLNGSLVASSLHVTDLAILGHLNDHPIGEYLQINASVGGDVFFAGNVTIHSEVVVQAYVDDVDIRSFLDKVVKMNDSVITGDFVFSETTYCLSDMAAPAVNSLTSSDLVFSEQVTRHHWPSMSGHTHFSWLTVDRRLCGSVNGVNVSQLCPSLMTNSPHSSQTVHSHLSFAFGSVGDGGVVSELYQLHSSVDRQQSRAARWMHRLASTMASVVGNTSSILRSPDASVDLAFVLLAHLQALSGCVHVQSVSAGASVLATCWHQLSCPLPSHCHCRATAVFSIDQLDRLSVATLPLGGQLWQFSLDDSLLSVHTRDVSYAERCSSGEFSPLSVSVTSLESGLTSVHTLLSSPRGFVSAVKVFSHASQHYLTVLASVHGESQVLVYRFVSGTSWSLTNTLSISNVTDFDVDLINSVPHLMLVSRSGVSAECRLMMFVWNTLLSEFEARNYLDFGNIASAKFIHGKHMTMAAVSDENGLSLLESSVTTGNFRLCQYIDGGGLSSLASFSLASLRYLAAFDSLHNEIVIFIHIQQDALRLLTQFPAASVTSIDTAYRNDKPYLVVAAERGLILYRMVVRGRVVQPLLSHSSFEDSVF